MRPEDFSPGNPTVLCDTEKKAVESFNEAGGFLPRKPATPHRGDDQYQRASMRPEDFSPGNAPGRVVALRRPLLQ